MVLPSAPSQISLGDIATEWSVTQSNVTFSDYYMGAGIVETGDTNPAGIPSSGQIAVSDFHGAADDGGAPSYTLYTTAQGPSDSSGGFGDSSLEVIWYRVGDASGRGGEVWALRYNASDSKLMDWVDPNSQSGDFYLQLSNLSGDTPTGWTTSWVKIGGTSSINKSLSLTVGTLDSPPWKSCNFDVALGTDGSTADVGPTTGWSMDVDAS